MSHFQPLYPGVVIDRAYAEYLTNADLSTALPVDDTKPQNTEGVQILSVSITPKSTTNRVRVRVICWGSLTTAPANLGAGLFRNSTADALRAGASTIDVAGYVQPVILEFEDVPGATSSQTYNVRVGAHTGATPARLNGWAGSRYFGGVGGATIVVEEIAA